jgi:hypothetical protein
MNPASTIEQTLKAWQHTELCFEKIGDCSRGQKNCRFPISWADRAVFLREDVRDLRYTS